MISKDNFYKIFNKVFNLIAGFQSNEHRQAEIDRIINSVLYVTSGFHTNRQRFPNDRIIIQNLSFHTYPPNMLTKPDTFPKYINLDCDFIFQDRANKCVDTSIEMITFFNLKRRLNAGKTAPNLRDLEDLLLRNNNRNIYEGLDIDEIFRIQNNKLFKSISTLREFVNTKSIKTNLLAYILHKFGPVVVFMSFQRFFSHAVVLKGVHGDTVIIHDPWYGADQHYHINTFNKYLDSSEAGFIYFRDLDRLNEYYEKDDLILISKFRN